MKKRNIYQWKLAEGNFGEKCPTEQKRNNQIFLAVIYPGLIIGPLQEITYHQWLFTTGLENALDNTFQKKFVLREWLSRFFPFLTY